MDDTFWRRCNTCKREIGFGQQHWTCSVSSCNRRGTSFVFCSVDCWQSHVPTLRHREAWAEEQRSPSREAWASASAGPAQVAAADGPEPEGTTGSEVRPAAAAAAAEPALAAFEPEGEIPHDVLIVASKLKKYVRARSGMNTSDSVLEALSNRVRSLCNDAILRAHEEGRKTLMDRDF